MLELIKKHFLEYHWNGRFFKASTIVATIIAFFIFVELRHPAAMDKLLNNLFDSPQLIQGIISYIGGVVSGSLYMTKRF